MPERMKHVFGVRIDRTRNRDRGSTENTAETAARV